MLLRLFRFLSRFPLPLLHGLGYVLGWIVYGASATYRQRLIAHITLAGYPNHLSQAISEAGKSITELPFVWLGKKAKLNQKIVLEDWDVVQTALNRGKGVIFLTPHLGCFEVVGQVIAQHTAFTALYRPPRKAALRPLLEDARSSSGMHLAPANLAGVRTLAKALKRGEAIGLLPDQVPQNGEGVWADFFGRPAYTMTLPAKLQTMTGAPIVLTFVERLPSGAGYVQRFFAFEEKLEGDPAHQAKQINQAMEKIIAQAPSQYFWSYHRYKKPSGVQDPEVVNPPPTTQGQA